jgi:predicted Rossmann fold flavoprotein
VKKKLVIIGGGASGFFCAINAAIANKDLDIILLEKQTKVLQKVKVSGGGRCNVTHACFSVAELVKKYPRGKSFLKKTFSHFSPQHTIEWFQSRGVQLKTEADGRMFPITDTSQTIIDCLLNEVTKLKIDLRINTEVLTIEKKSSQFLLQLKNGHVLQADYVFVGTGGFPKAEQYQWLQQLGHTIELPAPSLFTFNIPDKKLHELMGLSVALAQVKITSSKLQEEGPLLITHWGMSGPAILRLSAWGAIELKQKNYEFTLMVNWLNESENQLRERWNTIRNLQGPNKLGQKNPFGLQSRLWNYLLETIPMSSETKWSELTSKDQNKLIHTLTTQPFDVKGKTTFKEEFVTCGGIHLDEIDPNTMESKVVSGLYFGGEIMNVDGITGGFNFQHAWTSGFIAGNHIGNM